MYVGKQQATIKKGSNARVGGDGRTDWMGGWLNTQRPHSTAGGRSETGRPERTTVRGGRTGGTNVRPRGEEDGR